MALTITPFVADNLFFNGTAVNDLIYLVGLNISDGIPNANVPNFTVKFIGNNQAGTSTDFPGTLFTNNADYGLFVDRQPPSSFLPNPLTSVFDSNGNASIGVAVFGDPFEFIGGFDTVAEVKANLFQVQINAPLTGTLLATSNQFLVDNGTDVFPACFQKGTHILTPEGEKTVELLRKGDLVISAKTGRSVPIKAMLGFIGTQANCPLYCLPKAALGENKPTRDLFLSHRHRVSLDGRLRHMVCLADMEKSVPTGKAHIEYYHIELADCFDTVIAEGVEVETFIDPRVVAHDWECSSACCTYIPIGPQPTFNESLFESLAITA